MFLALIGILIIYGIYSNVRHELIIKDAETYWNNILQQRAIYFTVLKFIPLLIGLLISVAQFVPEIVEKRIKLTLHLPTNEETIVLKWYFWIVLYMYDISDSVRTIRRYGALFFSV